MLHLQLSNLMPVREMPPEATVSEKMAAYGTEEVMLEILEFVKVTVGVLAAV